MVFEYRFAKSDFQLIPNPVLHILAAIVSSFDKEQSVTF